MNCPNCNVSLFTTIRIDVEIDYCPECRGVWLDRGELDKIIDLPIAYNNLSEKHGKDHESGSIPGSLFDF
ncbi:zf-TFIIB domain-containing protein [Gelidibacter sp.]|uniref:TFIIB-type zinc ribbon-containing protein n=1 Tax=Gelidibacter sp. TaxID=2018083 RepID=UPI0032657388